MDNGDLCHFPKSRTMKYLHERLVNLCSYEICCITWVLWVIFQLSRLVRRWKKHLYAVTDYYYCLSLPIPHTTFLFSFFTPSSFSLPPPVISAHLFLLLLPFHTSKSCFVVVLFVLLPSSKDLASFSSPFSLRRIRTWAATQQLPGLTQSQKNLTWRFPFRADLQPTTSECPYKIPNGFIQGRISLSV